MRLIYHVFELKKKVHSLQANQVKYINNTNLIL